MTVEFKYDHNGLRTQKKVTSGGVVTTTEYTLHGKLITHLIRGSDAMHFYYDAQSRPAMVKFNAGLYGYVHNLQGDVVGIVDSNGSLVVEYGYDAWGKPVLVRTLTTAYETLAALNPFRYRGYVFDEETGLYCLRKRSYNPTFERFINADIFTGRKGIAAHNVYAYCRNQCLNSYDSHGAFTIIFTIGLEDAVLSSDEDATEDMNDCSCIEDIIVGGVIPVTGGPPNGYLSGKNGHGDLYEGWYDSDGNIERARHHSTHGNDKHHENPHDHEGSKDEKGRPSLNPKSVSPDPKYKTPEEESNGEEGAVSDALIAAGGIAGAIYILYRASKVVVGALVGGPVGAVYGLITP